MADLDPLGLFPNSRMAQAARLGQSRFYSAEAIVVPFTPAIWNVSDKSANMGLSNGNLTAATTTAATGSVRANAGSNSGKCYWEMTYVASNQTGTSNGLVPSASSLPIIFNNVSNGAATITGGGAIYVSGVQVIGSTGSISAGVRVCIAANLDAKLIWFRIGIAGNWNGSGTANPATGVGGVNISTLSLPLFPYFTGSLVLGEGITANFGATAFSGVVPAGFVSGWGT